MTAGRIPSIEGGIQPTIVDAKGDLITAVAADTPARIAVGANDTVLTADSTTATGLKWATPSGGGKLLQVVSATTTTATTFTSATYADTTITATITPTSATSKILVMVTAQIRSYTTGAGTVISNNGNAKIVRGATDVFLMDDEMFFSTYIDGVTANLLRYTLSFNYLDSPATTSATTYKVQAANDIGSGSSSSMIFQNSSNVSQIILMEIGA